MKIDVHVHLLRSCNDIQEALANKAIYYDPEDNNKDLSSFFIKNIVIQEIKGYINNYLEHEIKDDKIPEDDYMDMIYYLLKNSKEIEGLVLLAMDANYHHRLRSLQVKQTDLFISNKYLWEKVKELNNRLVKDNVENKKFFFGASVNPNKENWKADLDYVINETEAVLLKIIPSVHDVRLDDTQHIPFYEMLRDSNLPLLCHVGPELAFAEGLNNPQLDKYSLLDLPLKVGVKVIATHCAAPFFPGDDSKIDDFVAYIRRWNSDGKVKLWADTSALLTSFRIGYLKKLITSLNPDWLVHGSDMPVPVDPKVHLPYVTYEVTPKEFFDFINTKNLFDREIKIKRAHDFKDSILSNARNVLRMPKSLTAPGNVVNAPISVTNP